LKYLKSKIPTIYHQDCSLILIYQHQVICFPLMIYLLKLSKPFFPFAESEIRHCIAIPVIFALVT